MAGELVAQLDPGSFYRESSTGYDLVLTSALTGTMRGVSLQKINPGSASGTPAVPWEYLDAIFTIPGNLTMATGLTFFLQVCDDGANAADLGLVVKFGISVKRLNANATTDLSTGAGTEQTGTVTLSSTTGGIAIFTLAIANANLNSAAVGDAIGVRIRRMGADAADTCNGRIVLVGGHVKNT
jgi:hypothetical protein